MRRRNGRRIVRLYATAAPGSVRCRTVHRGRFGNPATHNFECAARRIDWPESTNSALSNRAPMRSSVPWTHIVPLHFALQHCGGAARWPADTTVADRAIRRVVERGIHHGLEVLRIQGTEFD
jgi:hypothetical protein